jgi:Phosphate-selective porin O and P
MLNNIQVFGILAGLASVLGTAHPASGQTPSPPASAASAEPTTPPGASPAPSVAPSAPAATYEPGPAPQPAAPPPANVVPDASLPPAPVAVEAPEPLAVFAGFDKGFFVQSDDGVNRLELGARVQPRVTYEARKGAVKDAAYFSVNRAELRLAGTVFAKELSYKFEADFGKGSVALKDFYVDYAFVPNAFHFRVGQFKKPWSRTGIASSGNLETNERAISDGAFGSGRDQGVMVHNNYEKSPTFEWALGLFNGVGEKPWFTDGKGESAPVVTGTADAATGEVAGTVAQDSKFSIVPRNFHPQLIARLGANSKDLKGYSEADLEGGPLRVGVGASVAVDFDSDGGDDSDVKGEIDAVLKVAGFSATGAFFLASAQAGPGFEDRAHGRSAFHAQLGYVIAGKVQPVIRYARVVPPGAGNDESEMLGGISFYPFKHAFKWQTDVGVLNYESTKKTDAVIVRSQVQLAF